MELTEIRYEVEDGVATITLHRPDRLNAFTLTMANELPRWRKRRTPTTPSGWSW